MLNKPHSLYLGGNQTDLSPAPLVNKRREFARDEQPRGDFNQVEILARR